MQHQNIYFTGDPPTAEVRRDYLNPNNPESPYFGFIGNKRAVDKLIRIDFQALGRSNHACSDLSVAFIGEAGCGKAQPLDATIYTPSGPKLMGDVKLGDVVCTPDGKTASIVGIFPQGKEKVYSVHFKDGESVECSGQHLWLVSNYNASHKNRWKQRVVDTAYILDNLKTKSGRLKFSIPISAPVFFDKKQTVLDPYLLGILLGDGNFTNKVPRFSTADKQIAKYVESVLINGYTLKKSISRKCDYRIVKKVRSSKVNYYKKALATYGLWKLFSNEKFIPSEYLINEIEIRKEVLRGLMDSDGHVSKNGGVFFYSTSIKLAEGVKFLVESIGGLAKIIGKQKKKGKPSYICVIKYNFPSELFKLKRKNKFAKARTKYFTKRIINKVEYVGVKETQCILIDSKDHLYITDDFIVTHNTDLARRHARANALPLVEISPKSIKTVNDIFLAIKKVCVSQGPHWKACPLMEEDGNYCVPPLNVFIDEVHLLSGPVMQGLLKATEHDDAMLVTEENIQVDCKCVHWMIATTDRGKLFDAFDTRFSKVVMNLYTKEEIAKIVHGKHPEWDLNVCRVVAHFCGRIPREALAFAREMQMEYDMDSSNTWPKVALKVAEDNEIDKFGMTYKRLAILKALGQGPVAASRLPIIAGCKEEELNKFILPWLLAFTEDQVPFVTTSHRGYAITEAGLIELNVRNIPNKGEEALAA